MLIPFYLDNFYNSLSIWKSAQYKIVGIRIDSKYLNIADNLIKNDSNMARYLIKILSV